MNPCDAKKYYDTEFEAVRAANIASYSLGAEMVPYRHNSHWHIANEDRSLRSKLRKFNRTYCEACKCYMRPGRWEKHIEFERHKYLARKMERETA